MKRFLSIILILCLGCAALAPALADPQIIVPEAYTQSGTLPIYRATARDFGDGLQPELFNSSGILSRDDSQIVFADESTLSWSPEALFYSENSGTFDANASAIGDNGTPLKPDIVSYPALSDAIAGLASWASSGWPGSGTVYPLEKTTLTHITLDEAKQTLETLLNQLDVMGYECDYALDMSVERILSLGGDMNAMIGSGEFFTNIPPHDFTLATAEDEGFYLRYHKPNDWGKYGNGDIFSVTAYVTKRGIVKVAIRDMYIVGEVYDTPKTLVDPQTALNKLPKEMAASRYPEKLVSVTGIELSYAPMRASNKADGMVLSPIWVILYQDESATKSGYTCWAEFNAVDGKLLNAIFK